MGGAAAMKTTTLVPPHISMLAHAVYLIVSLPATRVDPGPPVPPEGPGAVYTHLEAANHRCTRVLIILRGHFLVVEIDSGQYGKLADAVAVLREVHVRTGSTIGIVIILG